MSIVKINAITVPADSGDELARRFAARAGAVDGVPGFEGFELLQPTDGRNVWLVVTRWADEESFEAWKNSASFGHGHGRPVGTEGAAQTGGGPEARDAEAGAGAAGTGGAGDAGRQRPVGVSAELWSFEPADLGK
ncbi:antibiotic biosynthesis monooxygenase [Sinomonas sp. R1AF57]|jgi:heme-degrading monooxygenase HmoA|uniref:antibiotic biosynthesis monooxygenase family protein n=1 Tax=Sinomonas sp. R1AF57 TaxID=2020377 RepID=UPI000B611C77|nr:antibiotic biosynthesis monooxygenase [Sinomonas sp. R1AF57]ASN53168.1 antibiotic biosynthesis monooxygenase [Sinomonas sp. R1AF57]